jgi:hypothetical protein
VRPRIAAIAAVLASLAPSNAVAQDGDTDKQVCIDAHAQAQELRNAKRLVGAKEKLLVCAREACPALVRQACSDLLTRVMQEMPTVAIAVTHPDGEAIVDATVTVDGEPWPQLGSARDIDPGVHEVRVSHPTLGDAKRTITVVEGAKSQIVSLALGTPKPVTPPQGGADGERSYVPPAGAFVFFGMSFAATGVGATLGGLSLALSSELDDRIAAGGCAPDVCSSDTDAVDDRDRLSSYRLGADVSFAVAGGLLAAGVIWWIVDSTSAPSQTAAAYRFSPEGVGFTF